MDMISSNDIEVVHEAMKCGVMILDGGNADVQVLHLHENVGLYLDAP